MKQLVLVLGVLLVWFLAVVSSSTARADTKPGPNTVFFCSDDLICQAVRGYGEDSQEEGMTGP